MTTGVSAPSRPESPSRPETPSRGAARPRAAWRVSARAVQAFYASALLATVAAALLPAVLFQPHSRIFLLKVAAVVVFASLPGLLYVQFIRFKGQSLYD